jgi:shikimate 5-dehydrogenase
MEKYGLIGHPIAHSGSPALFAAAYGGRWPYDLIEGDDFETSWQQFLNDYQAINITAPFKEKAFGKLVADGVLDDVCQEIGAVNIAVRTADGGLCGYNSDYLGVLKILRERGFGPGSTVVVAGFGGAGKAAFYAARAAGCDAVVCNRTRHKPFIRPLEDLPVLLDVADILIYTLAFPVAGIDGLADGAGPAGLTVLEANYRTPCLAGCRHYIPGTEWLRAQAITGYPLMTGCEVTRL